MASLKPGFIMVECAGHGILPKILTARPLGCAPIGGCCPRYMCSRAENGCILGNFQLQGGATLFEVHDE